MNGFLFGTSLVVSIAITVFAILLAISPLMIWINVSKLRSDIAKTNERQKRYQDKVLEALSIISSGIES